MNNRIKRTNDELKADRPTLEENKSIPKLPISILVENVRSVHNVGSIFRSADGFGACIWAIIGDQDYKKDCLQLPNVGPQHKSLL